jgi:hypothetical protein
LPLKRNAPRTLSGPERYEFRLAALARAGASSATSMATVAHN